MIKLIEAYILKEAKCPKCGNPDAYVGFNSAECPNKNCSNFSQRQYDEINKDKINKKNKAFQYTKDYVEQSRIKSIKEAIAKLNSGKRFFIFSANIFDEGTPDINIETEIDCFDTWDEVINSQAHDAIIDGDNLTDPDSDRNGVSPLPKTQPRSCKRFNDLIIDRQNLPKDVLPNSIKEYVEDFINDAYESLSIDATHSYKDQ